MNLSIIIITFNEEHNIGRTLRCLKTLNSESFTSEIIIIDSGSNDTTEEISRQFTEKIYFNKWNGYSAQRNFGITKAKGDWLLFLDADEEITESLAQEIIKVCLKNSPNTAYKIKRKSFYLDKLLNYSWQPDIHLRLVPNCIKPVWKGNFVHEKLKFEVSSTNLNYVTLPSYIIHHSYKDIQHHFEKSLKYAKLSAEEYFQKGKQFKYRNLIFNPIFAFIKFYILRRGFLDGFPGLLAGISSAYYTFMKYAFLKALK